MPPITTHPDPEAAILEVMRRHWGYTQFRPHQRDAMVALAEGRDGVVVFPTGGGKSLCYQAPAAAFGSAVVVSPLISLMHDQVTALTQWGIAAACLNSTLGAEEAGRVTAAWMSGRLKVLYVAPERLVTAGFLAMLRGSPPTFFAIDEAHCISHWGHDFRPDYRQLSMLRERFPACPIHAYTATATVKVREDIAQQLRLSAPGFFVGNCDRPNLHYRVEPRHHGGVDQICEIMRTHAGKSGIVYCITRKRVEQVAAKLTERGFRAVPYHAGMEDGARRAAQEAFTNEEVDAVVATVAFGMGIDRSNVRFVIHCETPKSVEHFQQETGRAGRDGLPADCVLLHSPADFQKWRAVFDAAQDMSDETRQVQIAKAREMERFASGHRCRHRFLVEYFGQPWEKDGCGNCDFCTGGIEAPEARPDSNLLAKKILSCVLRLSQRRGAQYTAWVLRGEKEKQVTLQDCGVTTFGILADETDRDIRRWIEECAAQGLLERTEGQYPVLQVTPEGWAVLQDRHEARLSLAARAPKGTEAKSEREAKRRERRKLADANLSDDAAALFEELRRVRMELARAQRVPPYLVFHDAALKRMCELRPTTLAAMARVPGVGEAKIKSHGVRITAAIADFCHTRGIHTDCFDE